MSAPQIPPRPLRSKPSGESSRPSEGTFQAPQIPPRPTGRPVDRNDSGRDSFATSPLNEPPFLPKAGSGGSIYGNLGDNASTSNTNLPPRPPSVTLPSIGQEGNEYADIANMAQDQSLSKTISGSSETTTSHVGSDLPLHAPKPSLSQSDARARIQGVTRTDSEKAASVGVGRRSSVQNDDPLRGLKSKTSMSLRSASATSTERPGSTQVEEQGIPEIGVQVPMYPNAGDVQAPSPAMPSLAHGPPSAGIPSDRARHHGRTRSGREVFYGPPGSYGLHGHGMNSTDKFEKAWYDKHPEALAQEGQYSPALSNARGDYVLSSEDLNKLVQDTAKRGSGFGTAANVVGLPDEQIGYMASEEYAARMASRPNSSYATKAHGNNSQTNMESPLRHTSFPANLMNKQDSGSQGVPELSHSAGASEDEPGVIHIDAPDRKWNKVTGEAPSTPIIDFGAKGGNTEYEGGHIDEQGYGVPILASDEVKPGSEWQKPAVSPLPEERRASLHDIAGRLGSRPGSATSSRPTSRPGSIHGHYGMLSRYTSHEEHDAYTPLDDVEEYEPLFKDDEKTEKKPLTQAERLKHRPDMRRRFPSQDIWEDTPNSLQLQAEVQSPPPPPEQAGADSQTSTTFESPEKEAARKGEVSELEKAKLLPKEVRLAKSNFKPHLRDDMHRPGLSHRFPSQDIWEDSPDSARLETTVGGDHAEEDAGLAAGAVVRTSALSGGVSREGATSGASVQPSISGEAKSVDAGALAQSGKAIGGDAKNAATAGGDPTSQAQQGPTQGMSISTGSTLVQSAKDSISGLFSSLVGSKEGQSVREGTTGISPGVAGTIEGQPTQERIAGVSPNTPPKEQATSEGITGVSSGITGTPEGQHTHEMIGGVSPNVPRKEQAAREGTTGIFPGVAGAVESQPTPKGIADVSPNVFSKEQTASEGTTGISPGVPPKEQAACEGTTSIPPGAVGTASEGQSSRRVAAVSSTVLGTTSGGQSSSEGITSTSPGIPVKEQAAREGTNSIPPSAADTASGGQSSSGTIASNSSGVASATSGGQRPSEGSTGISPGVPLPGQATCQGVAGVPPGIAGVPVQSSPEKIAGVSPGAAGTLEGQTAHGGITGVPLNVSPQVQATCQGTTGTSPGAVIFSGSQSSSEKLVKGQSASEGIAGVPQNVLPQPLAPREGNIGTPPNIAGISKGQTSEGTSGDRSASRGIAGAPPSATGILEGQAAHEGITGITPSIAGVSQLQPAREGTAGVSSSTASATQGPLSHKGNIGDSASAINAAQGHSVREETAGAPTTTTNLIQRQSTSRSPAGAAASTTGTTQVQPTHERNVGDSASALGAVQGHPDPGETASTPITTKNSIQGQSVSEGTAGVATTAVGAPERQAAHEGATTVSPNTTEAAPGKPAYEKTVTLPSVVASTPESKSARKDTLSSPPGAVGATQEKVVREGAAGVTPSAVGSAQGQSGPETTVGVPTSAVGDNQEQAAHEGTAGVSTSAAEAAQGGKPVHKGSVSLCPSVAGTTKSQPTSERTTSVLPGAVGTIQEKPAHEGTAVSSSGATGSAQGQSPTSVAPSTTTNAAKGQTAHERGAGIPGVVDAAQEKPTHEGVAGYSSSATGSAQGQPPSEVNTSVPLGTTHAAQGQAAHEGGVGLSALAGDAGNFPSATGSAQRQPSSEPATSIPPSTTKAAQGNPAHEGAVGIPGTVGAAQEAPTQKDTTGPSHGAAESAQRQRPSEPATSVSLGITDPAHEKCAGLPNAAGAAHERIAELSPNPIGSAQRQSSSEVTTGVPLSTTNAAKGQAVQGQAAQGQAVQGQAAHSERISTPTVTGATQGKPVHEETFCVPANVVGTTKGQPAHKETTTGIPNVLDPAQKQPAIEGDVRGPTVASSTSSQVPQESSTKATSDSKRPVPSQSASRNTSTGNAHSMSDIPVQAKERATAAEISFASISTSSPSQTNLDSTVTNKSVPKGSKLGQTPQSASGAGSVPISAVPEGQLSGTGSPTISADHGTQGSASEGSHAMPQIPPRPSKHKDSSLGQATHPQVPARPHKHPHPHHHHATSPHEQSRLSEVYTAPPQSSEEQHQRDSEIFPLEGQRGSPTEGRKAPVVPHRPKPHAPRTADVEALNVDEAATPAAASRKAYSPSYTGSPEEAPLGFTSANSARKQHDKHPRSTSPDASSPISATDETKATGASAVDHVGLAPSRQSSQSGPTHAQAGGLVGPDHTGLASSHDKSASATGDAKSGGTPAAARHSGLSPSHDVSAPSTRHAKAGGEFAANHAGLASSRDPSTPATGDNNVAGVPATDQTDLATSPGISTLPTSDARARGTTHHGQAGLVSSRDASALATSDAKARSVVGRDHADPASSRNAPASATRGIRAEGVSAPHHTGSTPSHGTFTSAAKHSKTGGPLALDHSSSALPRDSGSADVPADEDQLAFTSGFEETTGAKYLLLDEAEHRDEITGDPATEDPSELASHHGDSRSRGTSRSTSGVATGSEAHTSKGIKSPSLTGKPKPAVPARPAGSKIAALQAGFMSDLNKRLQVGPQPVQKVSEPSEEKREEKAPLADARKARAKGPTRRKPAASPSPAAGTGMTTSTGVVSGASVDAGTSAALGSVSAPSTTFEPICLWQVPSTGVFDPVHANYLIKHQPKASLDDTAEDSPIAHSNLASEPTSAVESAKESMPPASESDVASDLPSREPEELSVEGGDV